MAITYEKYDDTTLKVIDTNPKEQTIPLKRIKLLRSIQIRQKQKIEEKIAEYDKMLSEAGKLNLVEVKQLELAEEEHL